MSRNTDESALRAETVVVAERALALPAGGLGANLAADLDSMQKLTLLVAVEDHFKVALDTENDANIETLDQLVAAIKGKLDAC